MNWLRFKPRGEAALSLLFILLFSAAICAGQVLDPTLSEAELTFNNEDSPLTDLSFNDYTDSIWEGSESFDSRILTWDFPGDKTVYLRIPKNAEVENAMMDLSYEEVTKEKTITLNPNCVGYCSRCQYSTLASCRGTDGETFNPGGGHHFSIHTTCDGELNGYGNTYTITCKGKDAGTYNGCGKTIDIDCYELRLYAECSSSHHCDGHRCSYPASCNRMVTARITYTPNPATNPNLKVNENTVWSHLGEFMGTETVDLDSYPESHYKRTIAVDNTGNSKALADYQIEPTLDTKSLISQAKMGSDCALKFTDTNGEELSYYVEDCNSPNTKIWVKIPQIPAGGRKEIHVYYGAGVTSKSSGKETFTLFDDFNTLDSSLWQLDMGPQSTYNVENSVLTLDSGGKNSKARISRNHGESMPVIAYRFKVIKNYGVVANIGIPTFYRNSGFNEWSLWYGSSQHLIGTADFNWHTVELIPSGNRYRFYLDGVYKATPSTDYSGNRRVYLESHCGVMDGWHGGKVSFEWIHVRRYSPKEPTISMGLEESFTTGKKINGLLNIYLENCVPDKEGYCLVPLTFHSDSPGQMKMSGVNVNYKLVREPQHETISLSASDRDSCCPRYQYGGSTHCTATARARATKYVRPGDDVYDFYVSTRLSLSYPPGKRCSKSAKVTCYKKDGGLETVDVWNKDVKLEDCRYIKIKAESQGSWYSAYKECTSITCTISGHADVYYSKPKEYIKIDPPSLVTGNEASVMATLHNTGDGTPPFVVTLLLDGKPQRYKILSLGKKESKDITFNFIPPGGDHTLAIRADSIPEEGVIPEFFEDNNQLSKEIEVEGNPGETEDHSSPLIREIILSQIGQRRLRVGCTSDAQCADDLSSTTDACVDGECFHSCEGGDCFPQIQNPIESYIINPTNLTPGDVVPIHAEIYNTGDLDAKDFIVTLEDNGDIVDYDLFSLEDGRSTTVNFSWTALPGKHTLTLKADSNPSPYGVVQETCESNNAVSAEVTVKDLPLKDIESGLLALWNMNEGEGKIAHDISGNRNHGTVDGAGWTDGVYGSALDFDGVDDEVDCGSVNSESDSSLTVSAWIRPRYVPSDRSADFVLGQGGGYRIGVRSGDEIYFWIRGDNSTGDDKTSSLVTASDVIDRLDVWYHVVGVWDGLGEMRVYVNGKFVANKSTDILAFNDHLRDNFAIGDGYVGSSHYFNGLVDEVRVYNRVLTPQEISYQYERYTEALIYLFSEGNGSVTYDSSPNNNTGFIHGALWSEGVSGYALEFDGVDDHMAVDNLVYDTAGSIDRITVCSWIKTTSDSQIIASWDRSEYWRFGVGSNGNPNVVTWNTRAEGIHDLSGNIAVNDGRWHHVCAVYDASTSEKRIYVDGDLDASVAAHNNNALGSGAVRYGFIGVGSEASGFDGSKNAGTYFKGTIDEFRIYSRALTSEEVKEQFQRYRHGPDVAVLYFDENNGSNAYDSSGNENHGVIHGAQWSEGISESALEFEGSGYVEIQDHSTLDITDAITVEAWVKPDETSGFEGILDKRYAFSGGAWSLYRKGEDVCWKIANSTGYVGPRVSGLTYNVWNHVVGTYDRDVGKIRLYVNGVEIGGVNYSNSIQTNSLSVLIGDGHNSIYNFNGIIDEVRVYDRALTPGEIEYRYKRYHESLIYHFSEGLGNKTFDFSMNNNTGFIRGANWSEGVSGSALEFDGDDYIAVDNLFYDSAASLDEVSVCSWIKTTYTGKVIASWDRSEYWRLGVGSDGDPDVVTWNTKVGTIDDMSGSTPVTDGRWHFVCGVYDSLTSEKMIYVDGRLDASVSAHSNKALGTGKNRYGFVGVGSEATEFDGSQGPTSYFRGTIDEFQIHSRILSGEEIREQYKSLLGGPTVALYYFDENNGSTAHDSSGNDNHGTVNGARWTEGVSESALEFDGDDYVEVPDSHKLDVVDEFTLEAWVKTEENDNNWRGIIRKEGSCNSNERPYLFDVHHGKLFFSYLNCGGLWSTSNVGDGRWHYVVAVHNSTKDRIYVDGVLDSERNAIGDPPHSSYDVAIGQQFNGKIDEVKIYRKALTSEQIQYRYQKYSEVAIYHFSRGYGLVAEDSSLNRNDGRIEGANWTGGVADHALYFNGAGDYVRVECSPSLDLTDEITLEAWINASTLPLGKHRIIDRFSNKKGYYLQANGGKIYFGVGNGTSERTSGGYTIEEGRWYHLVGVYDPRGGQDNLKLYINGELKKKSTVKGFVADAGKPLAIGSGNEFYTQFFHGTIDEVRIYSRVLSAEQIRDHFMMFNGSVDWDYVGGSSDPVFPVNPDSGSGVGSEDESTPLSIPSIPMSHFIPLMSLTALAAAVYLFSYQNSGDIRAKLDAAVSKIHGRGVNIQNRVVDSIVLDGRDTSYVNLEHVKTDEIVIRNMESLRYIDLENVEAERIIIENTDVLGELNLRNVKVKEIIVRNSEIGGDFTLISQLTDAASGNRVTVENLKVDGGVNVNLSAALGDVDGISIRDVVAGDVMNISAGIKEGVDAGSITLDNLIASEGMKIKVKGVGRGSIRGTVISNLVSGKDLRINVTSEDRRNLGGLDILHLQAAGGIDIESIAGEKSIISGTFVKDIVAGDDISLEFNARDEGRNLGIKAEGLKADENISLSLDADYDGEVEGSYIRDLEATDFSVKVSASDGGEVHNLALSDVIAYDSARVSVYSHGVDDGGRRSYVNFDVYDLSVKDDLRMEFIASDQGKIAGHVGNMKVRDKVYVKIRDYGGSGVNAIDFIRRDVYSRKGERYFRWYDEREDEEGDLGVDAVPDLSGIIEGYASGNIPIQYLSDEKKWEYFFDKEHGAVQTRSYILDYSEIFCEVEEENGSIVRKSVIVDKFGNVRDYHKTIIEAETSSGNSIPQDTGPDGVPEWDDGEPGNQPVEPESMIEYIEGIGYVTATKTSDGSYDVTIKDENKGEVLATTTIPAKEVNKEEFSLDGVINGMIMAIQSGRETVDEITSKGEETWKTFQGIYDTAIEYWNMLEGVWNFITDPGGTVSGEYVIFDQPIIWSGTLNKTSSGIGGRYIIGYENDGYHNHIFSVGGSAKSKKINKNGLGYNVDYGGKLEGEVDYYSFNVNADVAISGMLYYKKDGRGIDAQIYTPLVGGYSNETDGELKIYPVAYPYVDCVIYSYEFLTSQGYPFPAWTTLPAYPFLHSNVNNICFFNNIVIEQDVRTRSYEWTTDGDRVSDTVTIRDSYIGTGYCEASYNVTTPAAIRDLHTFLYYSNEIVYAAEDIENKSKLLGDIIQW